MPRATLARAIIAWMSRERFKIFTPYNKAFVKTLKRGTVSRQWNPDEKFWYFNAVEYATVLRLVEQYYGQVEIGERPVPPPSSRATHQPTPFDVIGVKPDAPNEVVEAAYRALVKLFHPDHAGYASTARMAAINNAMDQIRKRR